MQNNICSWIKCQREQVGEGRCLLCCSSDGQRGGVFESQVTLGAHQWGGTMKWGWDLSRFTQTSRALPPSASWAKQLLVFLLLPFWCKIHHLNFAPADAVFCLCRNVTNYQQLDLDSDLETWKCLKRFSHLCFGNHDVPDHVISSLHMQFQHYPWKEETHFFKEIIKYNGYKNHYCQQTNVYKEKKLWFL